MKDPAVRKNGSCAHCRGERPEAAVREGDPFCTAACCRAYHGVELSQPEQDSQVRKPTTKGTIVLSNENRRRAAGFK